MKTCYFGGELINGKSERHHLIARRFFGKRQNHRDGNLVDVCHDHHVAFHRLHDSPKWSLKTYLERMKAINYGKGIFADHWEHQRQGRR